MNKRQFGSLAFALALALGGCGGGSREIVVEQEEMSPEEQQAREAIRQSIQEMQQDNLAIGQQAAPPQAGP